MFASVLLLLQFLLLIPQLLLLYPVVLVYWPTKQSILKNDIMSALVAKLGKVVIELYRETQKGPAPFQSLASSPLNKLLKQKT